MLANQLRATIECARDTRALGEAIKAIYQAVTARAISWDEAETLQVLADAHGTAIRGQQTGSRPSSGSRPTIFPPKRPTPRYDRSAARQRRRGHSRDRWMPDHLADRFTDGELASLSVIAMEHQKHGICSLTVGAIAAFAGVSERTARYAIRAAEDLGLITVERIRPQGQKNLPNVVHIACREWTKWIERRPANWKVRIGCKKLQSSSLKGKNLPLTPSSRAKQNRRKGYRNGEPGHESPDIERRRG